MILGIIGLYKTLFRTVSPILVSSPSAVIAFLQVKKYFNFVRFNLLLAEPLTSVN